MPSNNAVHAKETKLGKPTSYGQLPRNTSPQAQMEERRNPKPAIKQWDTTKLLYAARWFNQQTYQTGISARKHI